MAQPDADVERAWLMEAQRRHSEVREGEVKPVLGEDVFENIPCPPETMTSSSFPSSLIYLKTGMTFG